MAATPGRVSGGGVIVTIKADNTAAWVAGMKQRVATEVQASASRIRDAASAAAPRKTGALGESGEVEQIDETHAKVVFGKGLPDGRAVFQELGTAKAPAQPYLTPAYQEEAPQFVQNVAQACNGKVTRGLGA